MIFEDRLKQCHACEMLDICKYSEIYYKNKGEWPRGVPQTMVRRINNKSECAHAPHSIL